MYETLPTVLYNQHMFPIILNNKNVCVCNMNFVYTAYWLQDHTWLKTLLDMYLCLKINDRGIILKSYDTSICKFSLILSLKIFYDLN